MGTTTPHDSVDHVEELIRTRGGAADTERTVLDGQPAIDAGTGPTGPMLGGPNAVPIITVPPAPAPAPASRGSAQDLRTGMLVGEYEILGKLGQGGMGVVYAATHPVIGKKAAVKVLRARMCADVEAIERFIQEARAVNQIGHPNIVDIFAFGDLPDGRSYLVMEMLAGESLQARLRRAPLSRDELCHYGDAIARALEAAHDKKIIHRDLKPENVFLHELRGERPIVKLLDFGIAKLVDTEDHRMAQTRTGAMMGTPQYISPEQARGYAIDFRADIYSLGVMLFEMITGRPPFVTDNAMDMVAKHLYETPPRAHEFASSIPRALDEVIAQMMDKDAARRPNLVRVREVLEEVRVSPAGAGAVGATALVRPVAARRPLTTGVRPRPSRRPVMIAAGALAAVVAAVVAFVIVKSMKKDDGVAAQSAVAPPPVTTPAPAPATSTVATPSPSPSPSTSTSTTEAVTVNVELDAGRAELYVDGERQAGDRGWTLSLPPGRHELEARRRNGRWHKVIEVRAGETQTLAIAFPKKRNPATGDEPATEDDPDELLAPGAPR